MYCLYCNGAHTPDSHLTNSGKFLAPQQKSVIVRAVENDPNVTGSKVIWNLVNSSEEGCEIQARLKGSVDRLVRSQRDVVLSMVLDGISVSGPEEEELRKIRQVCEGHRFDKAITAHNLS